MKNSEKDLMELKRICKLAARYIFDDTKEETHEEEIEFEDKLMIDIRKLNPSYALLISNPLEALIINSFSVYYSLDRKNKLRGMLDNSFGLYFNAADYYAREVLKLDKW